MEVFAFGLEEAHDPKTHAMRVAEHVPIIEHMYQKFKIENDSMSLEQLEGILTTLLNRKVTKAQVEMTMIEIDDDESGTIEVDEFVEWFVSKNVEGPNGYGTCCARFDPVTMFGTYAGFGLGNSNITYVAKSDCETYTVSSERLVHEFSPYKEVMKLIDFALVAPAKEYGPRVDIDGPNREDRKIRLEQYKQKMENAEEKRKKAMRRVSRRFRASTRTQREMKRLQGKAITNKRLSVSKFLSGGMFAEVDEEEEEKDDNGEEEGKNNKEIDYKNRPVPSMKGLSRVVTLLQKQVKDSEDRILEMLEKKMESGWNAGSIGAKGFE